MMGGKIDAFLIGRFSELQVRSGHWGHCHTENFFLSELFLLLTYFISIVSNIYGWIYLKINDFYLTFLSRSMYYIPQ